MDLKKLRSFFRLYIFWETGSQLLRIIWGKALLNPIKINCKPHKESAGNFNNIVKLAFIKSPDVSLIPCLKLTSGDLIKTRNFPP